MNNIYEINILDNDVQYSQMINYVDFVAKSSFDENGKYHKYLKDYSEAIAIISMYTDCGDTDLSFDVVMPFIQSEKWYEIKTELGIKYVTFHNYVDAEVEYMNQPLRNIDVAIKAVGDAANNINKIIECINVDELKKYDFSEIIKLIDKSEQ